LDACSVFLGYFEDLSFLNCHDESVESLEVHDFDDPLVAFKRSSCLLKTFGNPSLLVLETIGFSHNIFSFLKARSVRGSLVKTEIDKNGSVMNGITFRKNRKHSQRGLPFSLIQKYKTRFDIVCETKTDDVPVTLPYGKLIYWNGTVIER
jgi:hypothetical protein